MKKTVLLFFLFAFLFANVNSQSPIFKSFKPKSTDKDLIVVDSITVASFLNNMLFSGNIEISNVTYTGNLQTIGYFSDFESSSGLDCGVVISTGNVDDISNPSIFFANTSHTLPGDSLLSLYIQGQTYDAIIIEFDVMLQDDSLLLCSEYVFASEEYPEYVNTSFNDMFGFFISGPNPDGGFYENYNMTKIPGTDLPVSINNLNNGLNNAGPCENCEYFIDNSDSSNVYFAFDGMTTVIPASVAVIPDVNYHVRLAVSDVGDNVFDSSVLFRIFSFSQPLDTMFFTWTYDVISNNPLTVQYNPVMGNKTVTKYVWDFGDGNFSFEASPIHIYEQSTAHPVKLFATNQSSKGVYGKMITPQGENSINEFTNNLVNRRQTKNEVILKFQDEIANAIVNVYTTDGKIVYSNKMNGNECFIPIQNFNNGLYIVKIKSSDFLWVDKFIK